jgi:rRNA maturation RNase YbeY
LSVEIHNNHSVEVDVLVIQDIANKVWNLEGESAAEIRIILVDDPFIKSLNQRYLAKDGVTDVIAFPLDRMEDTFEGEIYISLDRVVENANHYQVPFEKELSRNVVHGLLHFFGYDDRTPAGKDVMSRREDFYLE